MSEKRKMTRARRIPEGSVFAKGPTAFRPPAAPVELARIPLGKAQLAQLTALQQNLEQAKQQAQQLVAVASQRVGDYADAIVLAHLEPEQLKDTQLAIDGEALVVSKPAAA